MTDYRKANTHINILSHVTTYDVQFYMWTHITYAGTW